MGRSAAAVALLLWGLVATVLFAPAAAAVPTTAATSGAPTPTATTTATASPGAPGAPSVTARGSAAGDLAVGSTIRVRVRVRDSRGWNRLDTVEVALRLTGQPLDTIEFVPSAFSVAIRNTGAPVSIGNQGVLKGPYFRLDNSKVTVSAGTDEFDLTFPLRLAIDPPPGALLVLAAGDVSGVSSGDVALSRRVTKQGQGFPWGTIGLAVAAALFIGGFVGNLFSTRRAKARPNVYATVARRLEQDRTRR